MHLDGGPPREGEQHDPAGISAGDYEMRDAMGEGVGFPRACTGNNKERRGLIERVAAMLDRAPLLHIQAIQIGGGHRASDVFWPDLLPHFCPLPRILKL